MQVHKLTAADAWFIEKGRIDALSRSPFQIGDEVVVCDKRHVMLAEFYDGECFICHSRNTVPFSRQSVEFGVLRSHVGKCPLCARDVTVLFRQGGARGSFVGRCPKCNHDLSVQRAFFEGQASARRFRKYICEANTVLGWVLGMLTTVLIVLSLVGMISHDRFVSYAENIIWPRTAVAFGTTWDLLPSKSLQEAVFAFNGDVHEKNKLLLTKGATVLILLGAEFQEFFMVLWDRSMRIAVRSVELFRLFTYKAKSLLKLIGK